MIIQLYIYNYIYSTDTLALAKQTLMVLICPVLCRDSRFFSCPTLLLDSSLFCQHGTVNSNLKKQCNYFSDGCPAPRLLKQRIPAFLFRKIVRRRQQHRPQTGQEKRDPCHPERSGHLTSNANFAVNVASMMR